MSDYLGDWYYMELNWRGNSFVRGPFTIEQMRELIKDGTIDEKTQVRCGPSSYWHPLKDAAAIFSPAGKTDAARSPKRQPGAHRPGKKQKIVIAIIILVVAVFYFASKERQARRGPSFSHEALTPREAFAPRETLTKEAIIAATNNARATQGLRALNESSLLNAVAEARARDMLEKQYFDHVSPTGERASDIAQRVGYRYKIIAENIAAGGFLTNQKVVDGWMQSPGHRKNLLSADVQDIGVAIIKGLLKGSDTWVSVQIFGLPSLPVAADKHCALPSQQLERDMEAKTAEVKSLNERLSRLKQELDDEKYSIDLERLSAGSDPERNHQLNVKINAYNEKRQWYNQMLADVQGKAAVLKSMIEEHNREVQGYRDCQAN